VDDRRLERIEKKLDDSNGHLAAIDTTLVKQAADWKYHVKRTDDLQVIVLRVNRHVTMVEGAIKLLGIIAALGAIYGVFKSFI
jgi:hypothetical protein